MGELPLLFLFPLFLPLLLSGDNSEEMPLRVINITVGHFGNGNHSQFLNEKVDVVDDVDFFRLPYRLSLLFCFFSCSFFLLLQLSPSGKVEKRTGNRDRGSISTSLLPQLESDRKTMENSKI